MNTEKYIIEYLYPVCGRTAWFTCELEGKPLVDFDVSDARTFKSRRSAEKFLSKRDGCVFKVVPLLDVSGILNLC